MFAAETCSVVAVSNLEVRNGTCKRLPDKTPGANVQMKEASLVV